MILFQYAITIQRPTLLILAPTGNLFVNPGMNLGILPRRNKTPFYRGARERIGLISFLGLNER